VSDYVPDLPTIDPVEIDRQALSLLALVDLNASAMRVMMLLLAHQNPRTGVAHISQAEVCTSLGLNAPTVSRAFKELTAAGIIAKPGRGEYQLNPALTCGKTAGPVSVPPIEALDPESFSAARRARYEVQAANLSRSA
jgi:DNA-binding IclR family transcriptional regulator